MPRLSRQELIRRLVLACKAYANNQAQQYLDDLIRALDALDTWADEWAKDDHPHAIQARAFAVGAHLELQKRADAAADLSNIGQTEPMAARIMPPWVIRGKNSTA